MVWICGRSAISLIAAMTSQNPHLSEVVEILAAGLMRLEARKSSQMSGQFGESSLHFTLDQSGDATDVSPEDEA
ncbi:hypothetical protein CSIRO_0755 [Bradyrhizobiaceae bacterium SG-6C]|nr:hypothetical protein CSIRO_0755 [Bradyrhizobiaceae bacterium SG-6C]